MDEGAEGLGPARPLWLDGWRDWRVGIAAALVSLAVSAWVLQVWEGSVGVPWFWGEDSKSFLLMFQNIQTTGWWTTSEVIGGGDTSIAYFPLGGGALVHVLGVRLLGLVVRDPITLYNVYFLLSGPVAAIAAYYAFRRLAMRPSFAFVISVLYSLLPYHFNRADRGHIFLAAYAAVPLAAMLVVRHAAGEPILVRPGSAGEVQGNRRDHVVEAVLISLLIGAATMYYTLMFAILLGVVAVAAAIRSRSEAVFGSAVRTALLSGVPLALGLLPTVLAWMERGLPSSVSRPYAAVEWYSFKLVNALMPAEGHRLPPFAWLRHQISAPLVPSEGPEALGLVGVFGAGLLAWWTVRRMLGGSDLPRPVPYAGPLAVCALVAFLLATTGGFGAALSAVGISFLRSWARMGIFIAFFALGAAGLWLQARATTHRWSGRRQAILLGTVLVVGILDQTTPAMAPDHEQLHLEHRQDVQYVASIEQAIGPRGRVLQLPYMSYPENDEDVDVAPYDPLRWPLTGSSLRWSFGSPKDGRNQWKRDASDASAGEMVATARERDYDAIMIDTEGYGDGAETIVEDLEEVLGPPILSVSGRFATFPLLDREGRSALN